VLRLAKSLTIPALAALLLCQSCGLDLSPQERPLEVALGVGGAPSTRTSPDASFKRFDWDEGDKIAVWAKSSDGSYSLENQTFKLYASAESPSPLAWFSATLGSAMADGSYTYYMCYPLPQSVSGTTATFSVPSEQDGDLSGGEDIIISVPAQGGALQPIGENVILEQGFSVQMKHLLHFLRFYIPEGYNLLGEPVERIEFTMPQAVAGTLSVDVTDAPGAALSSSTTSIKVSLKQSLSESSSNSKQYAAAAIFPPTSAYTSSDQMQVTIGGTYKYAEISYGLNGRNFAAGHVTAVALKPETVKYRGVLFTLTSNNLGEDLQKITVTLPTGVNWPGTSSNSYTYTKSDGSLIKLGDSFIIEATEQCNLTALSGQTVTVSYESESAIVSNSVTIGIQGDAANVNVSLDCPYLFFEDFSTVESFNSGDKHSSSNTGSKDPKVFNGWSVARAGAQAGTAIRLAAHREWFANYPSRADSPFLSGLKEGKTVNLDIQFDYSMGRDEGGLGSGTNSSQTVYLGYITTSNNLKSGDETGTWPSHFELNETTGSYDYINHQSHTTLTEVKAPLRLSWRTITPTSSDTTNSTCWLYIDNIKVKISK
jgi:hypothetical protein